MDQESFFDESVDNSTMDDEICPLLELRILKFLELRILKQDDEESSLNDLLDDFEQSNTSDGDEVVLQFDRDEDEFDKDDFADDTKVKIGIKQALAKFDKDEDEFDKDDSADDIAIDPVITTDSGVLFSLRKVEMGIKQASAVFSLTQKGTKIILTEKYNMEIYLDDDYFAHGIEI